MRVTEWQSDRGWKVDKGRRMEDGVTKVVGNRIRNWNRCQGITKSKGNQNKRTKDQKSKNKGKVKMVYDKSHI